MQTDRNNIATAKYILLDWNVIKYLKTPRDASDEECLRILNTIKKRYAFPFCEAHLLDLAQSNSEQNKEKIQEDLIFLQQLSSGVAIGRDKNDDIRFCDCSASDSFDDIIKKEKESKKPNNMADSIPLSISQVDMQKLNPEHPLWSMLEKTNGVIGPDIFTTWLNELYDRLFSENTDYKRIRQHIKKFKTDITNTPYFFNLQERATWKYLIEHMMPFFDVLDLDNEDALSEVWKYCIAKWLEMSFEKEIPFGHVITIAYAMLDFHPLFSEKLKKKNTASNITRDSKIIYYASYAKYFVTEDKACYEKAEFLFKAYQLSVKVLHMAELGQKFS